ncbi:alpha/beta fold hydrolase [Actinoplanes sp. NPDC049265]|uniref:alpha/beta fold hydrolase n=1 Tax=Actinoplanes sp. NPDC049265 TaxID=3363902 RepID=UPI003713CAA2
MELTITSADGTRLAVRRQGRGPAVVLVHGSAGGLDSFDPIAPYLEEQFELWVYARRGYAPSDTCRRPKIFDDDVADLRAAIAATGREAHVVGASYGAMVALHGAAEARSVALFEPPLFAAGDGTALKPYRRLVHEGRIGAANRLFAEQVARVPAAMLGDGEIEGDPREAIGCLHDLEAMAADDPAVSRWAAVSVPTLIMQGGDTWAPMPATMDALAAAIPKATRVVLPGQSHFATHTAPELFAAELTKFLTAAV